MAARERRRAEKAAEEETQLRSRRAPRLRQSEDVPNQRAQWNEGLQHANQWQDRKTRRPRAKKMASYHS